MGEQEQWTIGVMGTFRFSVAIDPVDGESEREALWSLLYDKPGERFRNELLPQLIESGAVKPRILEMRPDGIGYGAAAEDLHHVDWRRWLDTDALAESEAKKRRRLGKAQELIVDAVRRRDFRRAADIQSMIDDYDPDDGFWYGVDGLLDEDDEEIGG